MSYGIFVSFIPEFILNYITHQKNTILWNVFLIWKIVQTITALYAIINYMKLQNLIDFEEKIKRITDDNISIDTIAIEQYTANDESIPPSPSPPPSYTEIEK